MSADIERLAVLVSTYVMLLKCPFPKRALFNRPICPALTQVTKMKQNILLLFLGENGADRHRAKYLYDDPDGHRVLRRVRVDADRWCQRFEHSAVSSARSYDASCNDTDGHLTSTTQVRIIHDTRLILIDRQ